MEAVDDKTGAVLTPQIRTYNSVARGYTYFEEGDIIFAKITPCMQNGKTAIVTGLLDGIGYGSTEFHVLRAKPGVDVRWVYHLLRTAEFRRKAEDNFEGSAGQRRVPDDFMKAILVPVFTDGVPPSFEDLCARIANLYRLRVAADRQLEATESFELSLLRRSFDTPAAADWKRTKLDDMADIVMGQSPDGATYNNTGNGLPLLNGPTEFGEDHNDGPQGTG